MFCVLVEFWLVKPKLINCQTRAWWQNGQEITQDKSITINHNVFTSKVVKKECTQLQTLCDLLVKISDFHKCMPFCQRIMFLANMQFLDLCLICLKYWVPFMPLFAILKKLQFMPFMTYMSLWQLCLYCPYFLFTIYAIYLNFCP